MVKILLVGAFGYGNLGDELLRDVFLTEITRQAARREMPVEVRVDRPYPTLAQVEWADALVIGPGGLLYDNKTAHFDYNKMYVDAAQQRGIPQYWIGVGIQQTTVNPFSERMGDLLRQARGITVRHSQDLEVLARHGVTPWLCAPDLAYAWQPRYRLGRGGFLPKPASDKPTMVYVVGTNKKRKSLVELLRGLRSRYRLYLLSFSSGADAALDWYRRMLRLGEQSQHEHLVTTPDAAYAILAAADVVLSEKYHALVLAVLAGTPVVAMNGTWKFACDFAPCFRPSADVESLLDHLQSLTPRSCPSPTVARQHVSRLLDDLESLENRGKK